METTRLDHWFVVCINILRFTAVWPGKNLKINYAFYMAAVAGILIVLYNIFFTWHVLNYESYKLELLLNDAVLYFSNISVMAKSVMLLYYRKKIFIIMDILEDPYFQPSPEYQQEFDKNRAIFNRFYYFYYAVSLIAALTAMIWPWLDHLINSAELYPPTAAYNFISTETLVQYFFPIYIHQACGIFIHMSINVGTDGLLSGLLLLVVLEVRMLKGRLSSFKRLEDMSEQDAVDQFKHYFRHYQTIERFIYLMDEIFSVALFVQFSMTSLIMCVSLLGFLIPDSTNFNGIALGCFLIAMAIEILAPCWLGTTLIYESEQLGHAAYCSAWLAEGKVFKRNMLVFVERAQIPLTMSGWKLFPLSLETFTRIMKSAYSFYTVLQNMHSD